VRTTQLSTTAYFTLFSSSLSALEYDSVWLPHVAFICLIHRWWSCVCLRHTCLSAWLWPISAAYILDKGTRLCDVMSVAWMMWWMMGQCAFILHFLLRQETRKFSHWQTTIMWSFNIPNALNNIPVQWHCSN